MDYPSHSVLQKRRWSKTAIAIIAVLVLFDIVLMGLLVQKVLQRQELGGAQKQDALVLKAAAQEWRQSSKNLWPSNCIVDEGTPKLCENTKDRDAILQGAEKLTTNYTVYVIDGEFVEGDITENQLIIYGLSKNALILVSKASCFQEQEVGDGNEFAVIYARTAGSGQDAACV